MFTPVCWAAQLIWRTKVKYYRTWLSRDNLPRAPFWKVYDNERISVHDPRVCLFKKFYLINYLLCSCFWVAATGLAGSEIRDQCKGKPRSFFYGLCNLQVKRSILCTWPRLQRFSLRCTSSSSRLSSGCLLHSREICRRKLISETNTTFRSSVVAAGLASMHVSPACKKNAFQS